MKNLVLVCVLAVLFFSCGDKEKEIKALENAIAAIDTGTPAADTVGDRTKLLFKASGFEPGWTLEIYKKVIKARLNYGDQKFEFERLKQPNDSMIYWNNYEESFNIKNDSLGKGPFTFMLIKKPCTNSAGDVLSRQVKIFYDKKEFKGCGEFSK